MAKEVFSKAFDTASNLRRDVDKTSDDLGEGLTDAVSQSVKIVNHAIESSPYTINDFTNDVFGRIFYGISLRDTSKTRKEIREFGTVIDNEWNKTKKEWDKTNRLLEGIDFTIDIGIGAGKAVLEMADGLGDINDFIATHSP